MKLTLILTVLLVLCAPAFASTDEFESADTSRITITNHYTIDEQEPELAPASSYFWPPSFSPNGKLLAYKTLVHGKNAIRVWDVKSRKIVNQIEFDDPFDFSIWSPDNKRLLVIPPLHGSIFYVDLEKLRVLPLQIGISVPYGGTVTWASEFNVYVLSPEFPNRATELSLESLTCRTVDSRAISLPSSNSHKTSVIRRYDLQNASPSLVVENKHTGYRRLLIKNVYAASSSGNMDVSRDMKHIAIERTVDSGTYERSTLVMYTLGLCVPPELTWKAIFVSQGFPAARRDEMQKLLGAHRVIQGTVFGSRINPLTDKVVGADRTSFKGQILFEYGLANGCTLVTTLEYVPICDGDVVTDIHCLSSGGGMQHAVDFGSLWAVVRALKEREQLR